MDLRDSLFMLSRYLFLIIVSFSGLALFYNIFTPLTFYPVAYILNFLFDALIFPGNLIFVKGYYASIIPACVAGSAYFLLLILALSTPMSIKKRICVILFTFSSFLILNILRIVIFVKLLTVGYEYFDVTHLLVWYIGSTILVITLWFLTVFLFNIRTIPIYTDFSLLWKEVIKK